MIPPELEGVPSPCYVVDAEALRRNARVLDGVRERTGCRILLALKAFSMWDAFPLLREHLDGVAASSLNEARLGAEEFGREVHVYAPAFRDDEFDAILGCADHVTFNSFTQWERFREASCDRVSCGIRVNPEHSEVKTALYDPCAPKSRLGVTRERFEPDRLEGIEGIHFHTLCELDSDALERTIEIVGAKFGAWIPRMRWVNFGGGHHITRPGYDVDRLCRLVARFHEKYGVQVYLEPGEAVALDAGLLIASVLDIVHNGMPIAILDTSAAAHMPDVIEMPYRPEVLGGGMPGEKAHTYRVAGLTCLSGDVIGDYSFDEPLRVGDRIAFRDMAHYSMVKNTTFNGVGLPAIALHDPAGDGLRILRRFGYDDFRNRLG